MLAEWSTFDLPKQSQFEYWQEIISQAFVPLIPYRDGTKVFNGHIKEKKLGLCSILELAADAHGVKRGQAEINRSEGECYAVKLLHSGTGIMLLNNRAMQLKPGDMWVDDHRHPFEMKFEQSFSLTSYNIPRHLLAPRLVNPVKQSVVLIPAASGLGPLIQSYLKELAQLAEDEYQQQSTTLIETLCSLLSLVLEAGDSSDCFSDRSQHTIRFMAVKNYVYQHLTDPALSPAAVANACGISVRFLHKLFKPHDQTFGRWLLKQRLERCREQIADPRFGAKTLMKISYDWGFINFSHFGRSFRNEYGICAREYRKQALIEHLPGKIQNYGH